MKFPGMGSIEHLFAEKSPEKQFMNNYYKAKGKLFVATAFHEDRGNFRREGE